MSLQNIDMFFSIPVHLRIRSVDQSKPRTLFPSTSAITYWQVEMEDGALNGGPDSSQSFGADDV